MEAPPLHTTLETLSNAIGRVEQTSATTDEGHTNLLAITSTYWPGTK